MIMIIQDFLQCVRTSLRNDLLLKGGKDGGKLREERKLGEICKHFIVSSNLMKTCPYYWNCWQTKSSI